MSIIYRGICSGLQLDDLKDLHKQLIDSADWLSNVEQIEQIVIYISY